MPDATFRFGNPGRRSETWRRLVAPRRGGAHVPTRYLHPKAKTARNVAPRGAEGPPAFWLRGSPDFGFFERKKHSFQFDSGNPSAWQQKSQGNRSRCEKWRRNSTPHSLHNPSRLLMRHQASLPCQQMAWAVPLNPKSLGKVAAGRGSSTPHFASVTLGYLGYLSETWRRTPHFASVTKS